MPIGFRVYGLGVPCYGFRVWGLTKHESKRV